MLKKKGPDLASVYFSSTFAPEQKQHGIGQRSTWWRIKCRCSTVNSSKVEKWLTINMLASQLLHHTVNDWWCHMTDDRLEQDHDPKTTINDTKLLRKKNDRRWWMNVVCSSQQNPDPGSVLVVLGRLTGDDRVWDCVARKTIHEHYLKEKQKHFLSGIGSSAVDL